MQIMQILYSRVRVSFISKPVRSFFMKYIVFKQERKRKKGALNYLYGLTETVIFVCFLTLSWKS